MASTNFKVARFAETSHESPSDLVLEETVMFDYDLVRDQHGEYAVGAAIKSFSLEFANGVDTKIEYVLGREHVGVEVVGVSGRSARIRLTARLRPALPGPGFRFWAKADALVVGVVNEVGGGGASGGSISGASA